MTEFYLVTAEEQDKRIDQFIAEKLKISRAKAQDLIDKGYIKVNGLIKNKSYRLKIDDRIDIFQFNFNKKQELTELIPQNIPISVLYRDEYLIAISKPPGMVVYPCIGHPDGTVINAIAYIAGKLANVGGPLRPGIVHRLDKDTSGAMIIALDDTAYWRLVEMFKNREVRKEYIALVFGKLRDSGKITSPIGRATHDRKKMTTKSKISKEAITEWKVIKTYNNCSLVNVRIITGRTHQIRVHFSSIGNPVLGDQVYGKKTKLDLKTGKLIIPRQMLHSFRLELIHPITKRNIKIEAPLPEDMKKIISILEENYGIRQ